MALRNGKATRLAIVASEAAREKRTKDRKHKQNRYKPADVSRSAALTASIAPRFQSEDLEHAKCRML